MLPAQAVLAPAPGARRWPGLTLAHVTFLAGVVLTPFQIRFGLGNFSAADAAILAAAGLIALGGRPIRFLPPSLSAGTYAFLLLALLSTFRAPQPRESVTQIAQFAFTFFIQLPVILTLAQSRFVVHAGLGLLLAAKTVDNAMAFLAGRVSGADRALPLYGESANQLAYPTAYLLPFLLYGLLQVFRSRRSGWARAAAILGAVPVMYLMLWALAGSGSRSATLASLVGAGAFLALRRSLPVSPRALLGLALNLAAVGLLGYALYESGSLPSTLRDRIELSLHGDETLTQDRVDLARAGWLAFADSPFLGVGLDNFRHVAHRYGLTTLATDPHNMWLDLLAKVGVFGTAAVVGVVVGWFLFLLRTQRTTGDPARRELLAAFLASMVAIMTIHLFIPLMLQRQYWLIYGLGLAAALQATALRREPAPGSRAREGRESYAR
jgi:O-antigen ligase